MPIQFDCECGKTLKVGEQHAGKRAKCPACGHPVTVPELPPPPPVEEAAQTDEDEAFRLLSEGADEEPEPRSTPSWQSSSNPYTPPRPAPAPPPPRQEAGSYAARALAEMNAPPPSKQYRAKTTPVSRKAKDPYAMPERRWAVNWPKVWGGLGGIGLGCLLLFGGLAAGRFFIWSPIIIIAGIIAVINGLMDKS